jgi:hypothetical protein
VINLCCTGGGWGLFSRSWSVGRWLSTRAGQAGGKGLGRLVQLDNIGYLGWSGREGQGWSGGQVRQAGQVGRSGRRIRWAGLKWGGGIFGPVWREDNGLNFAGQLM